LDGYLSIDEARNEYKVSRATVFRWLASGKLMRYKREGDPRTMLKRSEVEQLVRMRPKG
jgi:predicted site-specific integrase-resolvase